MKLTLHDARLIDEKVIPPSTKHLSANERFDGTCQMLDDLERLAKDDGCIAATSYDYLPDCICDENGRCDTVCPCHGSLQRGKTQRKALAAVYAGRLSRGDYNRWLKKYKQTKKRGRPFGSIK